MFVCQGSGARVTVVETGALEIVQIVSIFPPVWSANYHVMKRGMVRWGEVRWGEGPHNYASCWLSYRAGGGGGAGCWGIWVMQQLTAADLSLTLPWTLSSLLTFFGLIWMVSTLYISWDIRLWSLYTTLPHLMISTNICWRTWISAEILLISLNSEGIENFQIKEYFLFTINEKSNNILHR